MRDANLDCYRIEHVKFHAQILKGMSGDQKL
jgi:hypothetical protein